MIDHAVLYTDGTQPFQSLAGAAMSVGFCALCGGFKPGAQSGASALD